MQKIVQVEFPPGSRRFEEITYETTLLEDLVGETAKRLGIPYSNLQSAQESNSVLPELVRHGRSFMKSGEIIYSRRLQQTEQERIGQERVIRELYEGRMPNINENCSFKIDGKEIFAAAPIRQYGKLEVRVNAKPVEGITNLESLREYLIQNLRIR